MKNIFKFFGIAVLACGMMVACNPDNNEPNDTTPTDNPTPTPTAKATVTFGTSTWDATYALMYTGYVEQHSLIEGRLFKTQGQLPYVDFMVTTVPGNYSAQITTSDVNPQTGEPLGYTFSEGTNSMEIYDIQYGDQTQVGSDGRGDWGLISATATVTAFDMNALTYSANITAVMYDYYSWAQGLVNDVEDADTQNLTVNIQNYEFNNWSK